MVAWDFFSSVQAGQLDSRRQDTPDHAGDGPRQALFEEVSGDELTGPNNLDLITVLDETGTQLLPVSGGGQIASGGYLLQFQWMRPVSAGEYQLRFHGNGAIHTMTLNVPASAWI